MACLKYLAPKVIDESLVLGEFGIRAGEQCRVVRCRNHRDLGRRGESESCIEETARHAGHADIVRESIDGATAYPLMAAAEGWPATPWLTPWGPGGA